MLPDRPLVSKGSNLTTGSMVTEEHEVVMVESDCLDESEIIKKLPLKRNLDSAALPLIIVFKKHLRLIDCTWFWIFFILALPLEVPFKM